MFSSSKFVHNWDKSLFPYKEPVSQEYTVTVNGEEIPVYTCRISKHSFNTVWPGHQRNPNQTTLVSYVNIVSDEALSITVKPKFNYERIMIKPYSKNIEHTDNNGEISFNIENEGQYVFMADSHIHTLYIFNSKPIECADKNSVTHYFGAGIHMPGKITLKDNESIYVDKDALVFGCIFAENAKNIHIFGNGVFDDTFEGRIDNSCYEPYTNGNIKLYDCENVRVEGVLFKDSAIWCVNIFHCSNVVMDGIKVFGQWRYNTDGVDIMNSHDITVKNSFIHSFDDTITIKAIDRYCEYDNENMLFENNVLWNDWGNTCEIGVETNCRHYKNIVFRNSDIIRPGNVALDVNNGECAEISDIVFENINVEYNVFDSPTVYQASQDMEYHTDEKTQIAYLVRIVNDIWRHDLTKKIWGLPDAVPIDLTGVEEGCIHDVTIKNINVYYDELIPKVDGKFKAPIIIEPKRDGIEFYNIDISGVVINGEEIDETNSHLSVKNTKNFNFKK